MVDRLGGAKKKIGMLIAGACAAAATCSCAGRARGPVERSAAPEVLPTGSRKTSGNCHVALEGQGWTEWKAPNHRYPELELRAFCQQGGPDHGSYKFQWRNGGGARRTVISWKYTSSAAKQDPASYTTRLPSALGHATTPQRVDYSCGAVTSAELCVNIIVVQ